MNHRGVPISLDFVGIPVNITDDLQNKDLKALFYDTTLLNYVRSLLYGEMVDAVQSTQSDEKVERKLFLFNAIQLLMMRFNEVLAEMIKRFSGSNSLHVQITHPYEQVYIELPQTEPQYTNYHTVKLYAFIPSSYLPMIKDDQGLMWVSLSGLPMGTRVLVGQTWHTVL